LKGKKNNTMAEMKECDKKCTTCSVKHICSEYKKENIEEMKKKYDKIWKLLVAAEETVDFLREEKNKIVRDFPSVL